MMNVLKKQACILLLLLFLAPGPALAANATPLDRIRLVAHRGLAVFWPENSMEAVTAARTLGIYGTEIDLRTTRDNRIILFHDATLDRTSTGTGKVSDTPYHTIATLFLKNRNGTATACKIPLFSTVLDRVQTWPGFVLALDVKAVDALKVGRMVLDRGLASRVWIFIPGPKDVALARKIKALDPGLQISINLLNWWQIMDVPEFVIKALDADAVFASEWFFPRHGFSEALQAGAQVQVYLWGTQNLVARMKRAASLGAQVISSERPDILQKALRQR
jgi:glycerophosphoryl diester phosphodiesterase